MTLHSETKSFRGTINEKVISSGDIDLIVSNEIPPRMWIKSIHIVNESSTFQLLDNEVQSIISAVLSNKSELIIRDGIIVRLHSDT